MLALMMPISSCYKENFVQVLLLTEPSWFWKPVWEIVFLVCLYACVCVIYVLCGTLLLYLLLNCPRKTAVTPSVQAKSCGRKTARRYKAESSRRRTWTSDRGVLRGNLDPAALDRDFETKLENGRWSCSLQTDDIVWRTRWNMTLWSLWTLQHPIVHFVFLFKHKLIHSVMP